MKMEAVSKGKFLDLPNPHIKIKKSMSDGYKGLLCISYNCMYIHLQLSQNIFLISKIYLLKSNQIVKQEPHKQHLQ